MPADSDLNLRCCAISSKRRHSNDINDKVHIVCCQMFYRKSIAERLSILFLQQYELMGSD